MICRALMGDTFIQECVLHGKRRAFTWKQLALERWGTNSPHQPPLYLIINIINPEYVCMCVGAHSVCFFQLIPCKKGLPCCLQLQNTPGLCHRPWMTFKYGKRINKKIKFHHANASSHPPPVLSLSPNSSLSPQCWCASQILWL